MHLQLSDLCSRSDSEYEILHRHTDSCAALGRSYELRCLLPPFCSPSEAALGFCRTGDRYMLYIRPQVVYSGSNRCLSELFAPGMRSFSSFRALTDQLRLWGSAMTNGDQSNLMPPLCQKLHSLLTEQVIGQSQATGEAARRIYAHITKRHPARPLSLVLHGPTGTGKTELCKAVAAALACLEPAAPYRLIRTDLNTYTEPHSVSRLIGSPPGYIGYEEQPVLEAVWTNPRTIFLFDELEKAHSEVLKIFMAILDEGRAAAHREHKEQGRELDFRRCIFLFTTNLDLSAPSAPSIGFSLPQDQSVPPSADDAARLAMVRSGVLREIAGRFTGFLPFYPLTYSHRLAITAKQISALGAEFGLHILSIAPEIVSAFTPAEVFSVRSSVPILERSLTPVFSRQVFPDGTRIHLIGTPERMQLILDRQRAAGES